MVKRLHSRICIVLYALCLASIILCGIFAAFPVVYQIIFLCAGVGLLGVATVFRIALLKCPACGKSLARPQWSKGRTFYCGSCGKPYEYDR